MRKNDNKVWSEDYGRYVAPCWLQEKRINSKIKLDITKCTIVVNQFGFYELWLNDKEIKTISFKDYMIFKNYVKDIKYKMEEI